MDATIFISRDYHLPLRALGRVPWLNVFPHEKGIQLIPDPTAFDRATLSLDDQWDRARLIHLVGKQKNHAAIEAVATLLAKGPKLFAPSAAQCAAMEHVSVDLHFADYQQAYPAIVIELPAQFAAARRLPRHVLCRHHAGAGLVLVADRIIGGDGMCETMAISAIHPTMEVNFRAEGTDDFPEVPSNYNLALAARIAVNCNLALTHYATTLADLNPTEKLRRRLHSTDAAERQRADRLLCGEFKVIAFSQEISFHAEQSACAHGCKPAVYEVTSHWRKGHWRRQPCGPRAQDRKRIFIKPIFVRADRFAGDLAHTGAVYRQPETATRA